MSSPAQKFINEALGAFDLAVCGALVLQGVLCAQFARYAANGYHRTDLPFLRAWVAGLLVLTLGKNVYGMVLIQVKNTVHYGNLPVALADWESIKYDTNFFLNLVVTFYAQLFFCWRLWLWLSLAMALLFVVALICGVFTVPSGGMRDPVRWNAATFSLYFVADSALCGSTIFFLLVSRSARLHRLPQGSLPPQSRSDQAFRSTASTLHRIAAVTIQSAAPAALCALVVLASSQAAPNYYSGSAALAVTLVATNVLPMVYAFAALWTLNARRAIRDAMLRDRDGQAETLTGGSRGEASWRRSLTTRTGTEAHVV
ncbi:unnamed protein product [Mycena citricolor]|uniref:Uncharacterized protein n=1 Tax=Mycena citricolor TaxID=2018698 RepID=A0AAD2K6V3_9AGAR|nr:unnamed protein product [Mycena citricolor]